MLLRTIQIEEKHWLCKIILKATKTITKTATTISISPKCLSVYGIFIHHIHLLKGKERRLVTRCPRKWILQFKFWLIRKKLFITNDTPCLKQWTFRNYDSLYWPLVKMSFKSLGHLLFVWQVKVDLLVGKNEKKSLQLHANILLRHF